VRSFSPQAKWRNAQISIYAAAILEPFSFLCRQTV
jgi:hypothetical protein